MKCESILSTAPLILAATLLLLALATFEPLPEKTETPVENTPALTEDSSMPAPANDTSETEPPKQAQEPPAPLPPTAENVPAAAPAVTPQPLPEGAESLAVWVQIRLPRTILPQTENYRCLNLDITQGK